MMLASLLLLPVSAFINVWRGRGSILVGNKTVNFPQHPFGRAQWFLWVPMGLMFSLTHGWLPGLLFGLSWLLWSIPGWGQWFSLGRPGFGSGDPAWWERIINKVTFNNPYAALTLRNLICLVPAALLVSPWALVLAPPITLAYELGFRLSERQPIAIAEMLTGLLWGLFIVFG